MSAPRIDQPEPLTLRPASMGDTIAMWRVAASPLVSPFSYATVLRRLPKRCQCVVAVVGGDVIGFAVAYRHGDGLHVAEMRIDPSEPASRIVELLHGLRSWPALSGARVVKTDDTCSDEVRDAVAALNGGVAQSTLAAC